MNPIYIEFHWHRMSFSKKSKPVLLKTAMFTRPWLIYDAIRSLRWIISIADGHQVADARLIFFLMPGRYAVTARRCTIVKY